MFEHDPFIEARKNVLADGSYEIGIWVGRTLIGVITKPAIGQRNWFWHGSGKSVKCKTLQSALWAAEQEANESDAYADAFDREINEELYEKAVKED